MALSLLASNNAQTVLTTGISSTATTLTVNTGTGALFPSPVSGTSFFKLTLVDAATGTLTEIVHVTQRSGDTMTIVRGQEGTTSRIWSANDIAANMMTAGTLSYMMENLQPTSGNLTALASLTGAADRIPYFTAAQAMALAVLTATGRGLISKESVADMLNYLTGDGVRTPASATDTATSFLASPNRNYRIVMVNTGDWGAYNVTTGDVVALPVQRGGTGGTTRSGAISGLGLLLQNRWMSAAQVITLGTPIVLNHGLTIADALACYSDVILVCTAANNGYSVGDVAIGPQIVDGATGANRTSNLTSLLTTTTVQTILGPSSIYLANKTTGTIVTLSGTALNSWRLYFRIFY